MTHAQESYHRNNLMNETYAPSYTITNIAFFYQVDKYCLGVMFANKNFPT